MCVLAIAPTLRYNNEQARQCGYPEMNMKVGYRDSEDAEVTGSLPEARRAGIRERGQPVARTSLKETHFAASCAPDLDPGGSIPESSAQRLEGGTLD